MALANSCSDASTVVQERVAGALWGLAASQANRFSRASFPTKILYKTLNDKFLQLLFSSFGILLSALQLEMKVVFHL